MRKVIAFLNINKAHFAIIITTVVPAVVIIAIHTSSDRKMCVWKLFPILGLYAICKIVVFMSLVFMYNNFEIYPGVNPYSAHATYRFPLAKKLLSGRLILEKL